MAEGCLSIYMQLHIVYSCVCRPKHVISWRITIFEHPCYNSWFVWHWCCWGWKCCRLWKPEMPCGSEQQQGLLQICTQCTMNEFMTWRSPWFFWMALRTFCQNLSNGFSIVYRIEYFWCLAVMGAVPETILISARGWTYPFDPTHQLGGITSLWTIQ